MAAVLQTAKVRCWVSRAALVVVPCTHIRTHSVATIFPTHASCMGWVTLRTAHQVKPAVNQVLSGTLHAACGAVGPLRRGRAW